jgi:hypothetical protein
VKAERDLVRLSRVSILMMVSRLRRLTVLLVLVAWVLLGPIAMAFDDCPAMMSMCEGPCGVLTYVVYAAPTVSAPTMVAPVESPIARTLPAVVVTALDPPPKSVSA